MALQSSPRQCPSGRALPPPWRWRRRRWDCRPPRDRVVRPNGRRPASRSSTVPPPCYSGAPCLKTSFAPTSAPVPNGAYILWAERTTKSRCSGSSSGLTSIAAVRRELGSIDKDACAGRVGLPGQAVDGLHEAGDVRGPAHGDECDAPRGLEQPIQIVLVETAIGSPRRARPARAVAMADRSSGAPSGSRGRWRPPTADSVRQLVDRLGRVLPEDHRVGARCRRPRNAQWCVRLVVGGRADRDLPPEPR